MNYTNLNIKSGGKTFKYIVEYFDDETVKSQALTYFYNNEKPLGEYTEEELPELMKKWDFFFFDDEQKNMQHQK